MIVELYSFTNIDAWANGKAYQFCNIHYELEQ